MAKQRYTTGINSLSYAKSEVPYVAQPTKEILGLLDKREEQYIKTKDNINLATELKNSIPYNPVSQGIYDNLVGTVNETLDKITPDNYADSVLDSAQLSHDMKNKLGGRELAAQQADYMAKVDAVDKTEGIGPGKKQWKKDLIAKSLKPITQDENGRYVYGSALTPKLVKDKDLFMETDKLVTGWKSSGLYKHDANGKISVDPSIVGKFGITKTTFNDEKELFDTAVNYLTNDSENAEYIDDEAEYQLYGKQVTPESVFNSIPEAAYKAYFPNKDPKKVSVEDLKALVGNSQQALQGIAKGMISAGLRQNVASAIANKHGYTDETKTFMDDLEYHEAIKAKYAKKTFEDVEGESLGDAVLVKTSITERQGSPLIYEKYQEEEVAYIKEYADAKLNFDKLIKQSNVSPSEEVRLREKVVEAKDRLERIDTDIQNSRQAQENLTKSTIQLAKGNDIDVEARYKKELPKLTKSLDLLNKGYLGTSGYTLDISSKIASNGKNPKTNGNFVKLNIPGLTDREIPVHTPEYAKANKNKLEGTFVIKSGNSYDLYQSPVTTDLKEATFNHKIVDAVGLDSLDDNPYKKEKKDISVKRLKPMPTIDQFNGAVSKLFMNPDAKITSLPDNFTALAKEEADKLRKAGKVPTDVNVNQTLDYLYVDKGVKKGTAAYNLLKLTESIDDNLISEGNQYKVTDDTGKLVDLPAYIKSLGLKFTAEHIDFSKTRTSVMLTSDREHGQRINMPLHLTAEGLKVLEDNDSKMLDNSGTLNLTAVNYTGKNSGFNKRLVDGAYLAYKETFGNQLPSGDHTRKALGLIAFENSQYSRDFYNKNLYTLPDGGKAEYTTPDGDAVIINAIKRSATPDRLGDNDFFLTNKNEDIFAYDVTNGKVGFISKAAYAADKGALRYKRQMYSSPEDIAAVMGENLLKRQALRSNSPTIQNNQVKTSGTSYTVKTDSVISNNHTSNVTNTIATYGKASTPRSILNYEGKNELVNSRINPNQLTYLKNDLANSIKPGVYPYLHNDVAPYATKIIKDYGLYVTSMYRPEDSNSNIRESAKNSLHLYGKSMDARYTSSSEKLLKDLESNPQMAENLGISYAFKHTVDGVPHLHIDFL